MNLLDDHLVRAHQQDLLRAASGTIRAHPRRPLRSFRGRRRMAG